MITDTLAEGVIRLSLDDIKLRDEVQTSQKTISSGLSKALGITRLTAQETQKLYKITKDISYLDTSSVKMREAEVRTVQKLATETQKYASIRKQLGLDGKRDWGKTIRENAVPALMHGASIAGMVGASATGLTFAAAAAAGSTTLDTLTGSLKMLSLAAGAKTQESVLKVARVIQKMAKWADEAQPGTISGIAGGAAGAGIGAKIGTMVGGPGAGTAIGAGLGLLSGGLAGQILGTKFKSDYTEDLATRFARNPDLAGKALAAAARLDKQADKQKMGMAEWVFANDDPEKRTRDAAKMLREAVTRGEAMRAADPDGFKRAGLGMGGTFSGLSDVRMQAQAAVFQPGGELGAANRAKELENNQKAMQPLVDEVKGLRQDLKQNGVAAPLNANP